MPDSGLATAKEYAERAADEILGAAGAREVGLVAGQTRPCFCSRRERRPRRGGQVHGHRQVRGGCFSAVARPARLLRGVSNRGPLVVDVYYHTESASQRRALSVSYRDGSAESF